MTGENISWSISTKECCPNWQGFEPATSWSPIGRPSDSNWGWQHMMWYSLEVPNQGTFNDYPHHMFSWWNKKNIYLIAPLIWSYMYVHCLTLWADCIVTVNVLKFRTQKLLIKWHMQTEQTLIRLLLRSSLIRVYTVCHSTKYFKK